MVLPKVILYGEFGLTADILTMYLVNSGFPAQTFTDATSLLQEIALDVPTIIVLALDAESPELHEIVQTIRAQTNDRKTYILIMNGHGELVAALPEIEIIRRPNHLTGTVQRIFEIARTSGFESPA